MADSTTTVLNQYHKSKFHPHLHKPTPKHKVETLYAYQLGPVSAAVAAHGTTNKWQGLPVIPLANSDEIHAVWMSSHGFDSKNPVYVRWGLISNAASKALTITTTVDTVDFGATHAGSATAGDGGTALNETIAAITTASNPGADIPFFSVWGKLNGTSTDFDALFVKLVASGATTADSVRVWCLQVAYRPLTA